MKRMNLLVLLVTVYVSASVAVISEENGRKLMSANTFSGLTFRSIGPALTSGRIGDFTVNPEDRSHYFIAVASGGSGKQQTPEPPGNRFSTTRFHIR